MSVVRKPDFFVVGAPKSATTSLYFYLKSHPQIFLPRRKELLYFCDDLHFNYPILSAAQFIAYYKDCKNQKAAGEVSVWNLLSSNAAANIFRFNPDAKIIALLRNPVDMIYALHSNHVFNSNENIDDFGEALHAEKDRRLGKRISGLIKCPIEGLYYSEAGNYATQLERYYQISGKEKVKVILFEDFTSDTKTVYADLLRFLNVNQINITSFPAYNSSKKVKSSLLKKLTIDPPVWLKDAARKILPHQSPQRDRLMDWLWKVNTVRAQRSKMNEELRSRLINQFNPGIDRLEKLIDRDLSSWRH